MKSADELKVEWMKDPNFRREYEVLAEEFALAEAAIKERLAGDDDQEYQSDVR